MKKVIFSLIVITSMAAGNLSAELINAREALELTKKEYENSYASKKESCDNALDAINKNIKSAIQKQNRWTEFNYSENKNDENTKGWNYSYFYESCSLNVLKYQLLKKGYDVRAQTNKTENHILISW